MMGSTFPKGTSRRIMTARQAKAEIVFDGTHFRHLPERPVPTIDLKAEGSDVEMA